MELAKTRVRISDVETFHRKQRQAERKASLRCIISRQPLVIVAALRRIASGIEEGRSAEPINLSKSHMPGRSPPQMQDKDPLDRIVCDTLARMSLTCEGENQPQKVPPDREGKTAFKKSILAAASLATVSEAAGTSPASTADNVKAQDDDDDEAKREGDRTASQSDKGRDCGRVILVYGATS
ncbi:hypothetical protein EV182_001727 [Spiromyces aspiralis]|uniref:Uncharacterized protein n=1 Tax=Spiromyces aspiralis TaxID=68401 RepID=A0ACC1HIK6_9FUNG|nr:hypothetical protein EV182_001727 [Spiromyces aspiralis]